MTNKPWGFVLGLTIGSTIGTIAGYFLSKKFFKPEQQMPNNNEIKEFYENKIKEILNENKPKIEPKVPEVKVNNSNTVPASALEPDGTPKNVNTYAPKVTEKDYTAYNKMYVKDDGGNNFNIRENFVKVDTFPHKITGEQWFKDKEYSKVTLIYYENDSVFATVGDEPTDYTEEYFGLDNLNEFGRSSNANMGHDSWTLMLRDELTKTDFQILYDGESSWETVFQNTGGEKD